MLDTTSSWKRISTALPYLAYDDETNLHLLDGNHLAFGFTALPLSGFETTMQKRFNTLMTFEFPKGAFLQFNLCVFDDIGHHLDAIAQTRNRTRDPLIRHATVQTMEFLNEGSRGMRAMEVPIRNAVLIITLKLPIEEQIPSEEETADAVRIQREFKETLQTIGFQDLRPLTDVELVHQTSIILNRGPAATWRRGRQPTDETKWLRDQIIDFNAPVEVEQDRVRIGDTHITSLSVKKFPQRSFFGLARSFSIDPYSGQRGIPCQHMITGTIYVQDITEMRPKLERKRQIVQNYAEGPFGKLLPEYRRRQQDLEIVTRSITAGDVVHQMSLTVTLFSPNAEDAPRNTAKARTYLSELGLAFLEDTCVNFPILLTNLPMGAERAAVTDLNRYRTMNSSAIATFMPVFFEWRGTPTPMLSLVGRGGQIMGFSPFDTDTNYNITISATSGSGKSFLSNEMIAAILGAGGKVWVIDVGRSYLKLCESLGGQFLHFGAGNDIVLNPFSSLKTDEEFSEVADILVSVISAMAAPKKGLDDFQLAVLRKILQEQYQLHRDKTTIDHLVQAFTAEALVQQEGDFKEKRLSDVAQGLHAFSSEGQYGRYFNGPANIDFSNKFVLLELEELKSQKHLQMIVLLLLIYQIQQGMYLGDRGIPKLMLIDEAWDLLSEPQIASFIEAGYRRFRKYNGSACIVTQSLLDLHGTQTGQAILSNSAATLMLRQKESTINQLANGDNAEFPRELASILKTVHTAPGRYSEVFIRSSMGMGIGRFIVDPFRALLYSTNPNDVAAVERHTQDGMSVKDAILQVLEERKQL